MLNAKFALGDLNEQDLAIGRGWHGPLPGLGMKIEPGTSHDAAPLGPLARTTLMPGIADGGRGGAKSGLGWRPPRRRGREAIAVWLIARRRRACASVAFLG